ncbi:MAG: flavodoxin family protein [Jejuia sp.]
MKNTVIIQASSRSDGDTSKVVQYVASKYDIYVINLKTKSIGHYDYDYNNEDDDFLELITEIIKKYDILIFATPVYWYSMSGILKVFFDRISDLLRIHKDTGRKLRGKRMAMISISNHDDLKEGFTMPFMESANYLGMNYIGDTHAYVANGELDTEVINRLKTLMEKVRKTI